ncbi:hypothetical protein [Zobellia alginiliquefaciens]|uniref:hypothetical protein n=1 Tax=Zobellia alginiliquefaciens TaxID=3032586 RepID=UPI0023E3AC51|nr:hypothetical protein [Zobellia alginiliquefaciens]
MRKQMHLAAQYLAAAGISFLPKKDDDSHTNLGWSNEKQQMETHRLSPNGDVLALDYGTFSLIWNSNSGSAALPLNNRSHAEVLKWIQETSAAFLSKSYTYAFHYDLPYTIDTSFTYHLDESELKELASLRTLAQSSLEKVLKETGLESDVRIWPHHFDSGAYASLNDDIAVGLGLAIPDAMVNEHYFYVSGYEKGKGIDTSNFKNLSLGEWKNEGFEGAVLIADHRNKKEVVKFFIEAINGYPA